MSSSLEMNQFDTALKNIIGINENLETLCVVVEDILNKLNQMQSSTIGEDRKEILAIGIIIKRKIRKGDLQEAIEAYLQIDEYAALAMLRSLANTKDSLGKGIITREKADADINKLTCRLLELLQRLEDET